MGVGPGEYGVQPEHSTFEIIRTFATMMRHAVVATPPRQECEAGCWLAAKRYGFDTCVFLGSALMFLLRNPKLLRGRSCWP